MRSSLLALMAGLSLLPVVGCASLATLAERRAGDVVTQWTMIGDEYGNGTANWRTLAIMQMAMHDALNAAARTPEQTTDAFFWAHQTSQRGFVELAVRLLGMHPPANRAWAEAHIMAELTAALADSAIIVWQAKERYSFWRPITALRESGVDATWEPLIETPPFPEYPSGHAADCYVGAGVLEAELPALAGAVQYRSSSYLEPLGPREATPQIAYGMGQHAQAPTIRPPGGAALRFASLADAATNCSDSRIWAGAHFVAAEHESQRLAAIIVARALTATPLLNPGQAQPRRDLALDEAVDESVGTVSSPALPLAQH